MSSRQLSIVILTILTVSPKSGFTLSRDPVTSRPADLGNLREVRSEVYRNTDGVSLRLHMFYPERHVVGDRRPAIVFFFGGGWRHGSAWQFVEQCRYFASRGMIAMTAEYRVYDRHQARVVDCVADAQSAIRWIRANASRLDVDPERITASGGSSGGHLAAATAMLRDLTGAAESSAVSFRPNALLLFNPALDLTPDRVSDEGSLSRPRKLEKRMGADARELSPMDHIRPGLPPTMILHGKQDALIPYSSVQAFTEAMKKAGNICTLVGFNGQDHGFFNYDRNENTYFILTMQHADTFLQAQGYLKGEPIINAFVSSRGKAKSEDYSRYLQAVKTFADNVLRHGRDVYGRDHTPLFVDGINIDTREPVQWIVSNRHAEAWGMPVTWVLSNLASQQHLFRVLVALTDLTGDPRFRQEAVEATRYAFDHLRHESGLLFWGGHAAWDVATERPVGEGRSGSAAGKHELKCNLPFYELMWDVDAESTRRFIEAFWSNHILRWDILDMNRHGHYRTVSESPWSHDYLGGPVPFVGEGLTFLNTACDLMSAAVMLHQFTGDERSLLWAKRLGQRYADVCHPVTGLGADNYSVLATHRVQKQFEPEFGDRITEASFASLYGLRYGRAAICQLKLYERLGRGGDEFKEWAIRDLTAFASHSYDRRDNSFWPMIIDGTKLTPADRKREGYISKRWLEKRPATGLHFLAYALAYRLTGDSLMWRMARDIGLGIGLGDIGKTPQTSPDRGFETSVADGDVVFGLLELHEATGDDAFLALAVRVGDNLLRKEFHNGFFVPDKSHAFCKFDSITPLALLHLYAAASSVPVRLPEYAGGKSYFHCSFDGRGRTYDIHVIYSRLRAVDGSATRPGGY